MIPVILFGPTGPSGYSIDRFEREVLHICEEHQRDRRASAFALILHDGTSPQFSKVLSDKEYWAALDTICGKALTVFSIFEGFLKSEDAAAYTRSMQEVGHRARRVVTAQFGLTELALPALLFFQVDDGTVVGSRLVCLEAARVEEAYVELSKVLQTAAEAVRDSAGQHIRDPQAAFARLDAALAAHGRAKAFKQLLAAGKEVMPWLRLLITGS